MFYCFFKYLEILKLFYFAEYNFQDFWSKQLLIYALCVIENVHQRCSMPLKTSKLKQPPEVFYKKRNFRKLLRNFRKFTGKQLFQGLFFN